MNIVYRIVMVLVVMNFFICYPLSDFAREKGFVYLHEVDPTVLVSMRYCTHENFLGRPVKGYNEPVVIMTRQAAEALKKVQADVKKDGYSVVVYDTYRPQQAVNDFVQWGKDVNDQQKKSSYYPRVTKADVFELGYVAYKSGHSRGSTVDLTLIKDGDELHAVQEKECVLLDGHTIKWLDDGTIFMGSSFDLFDLASHTDTDLIKQEYKDRRMYLKSVMSKHGFVNLPDEWWHYTLKDEPYPARKDSSYFDFVIE